MHTGKQSIAQWLRESGFNYESVKGKWVRPKYLPHDWVDDDYAGAWFCVDHSAVARQFLDAPEVSREDYNHFIDVHSYMVRSQGTVRELCEARDKLLKQENVRNTAYRELLVCCEEAFGVKTLPTNFYVKLSAYTNSQALFLGLLDDVKEIYKEHPELAPQ